METWTGGRSFLILSSKRNMTPTAGVESTGHCFFVHVFEKLEQSSVSNKPSVPEEGYSASTLLQTAVPSATSKMTSVQTAYSHDSSLGYYNTCNSCRCWDCYFVLFGEVWCWLWVLFCIIWRLMGVAIVTLYHLENSTSKALPLLSTYQRWPHLLFLSFVESMIWYIWP